MTQEWDIATFDVVQLLVGARWTDDTEGTSVSFEVGQLQLLPPSYAAAQWNT